MSEHVEMYLVMIALLREDMYTPVPLSLLAQKLAISPVSANEMCRKLAEQGLVQYQPYKGVTLTMSGEAEAQNILSRRRLWVVFLVEELGIEPDEADEIACELEHITSERLVTALKAYLEQAASGSRSNVPTAARPAAETQPLTACAAGQQGYIASINADPATTGFFQAQGVAEGTPIDVLAVSDDGTLLLGIGHRRFSLSAPLAEHITVALPAAVPPQPCTWDKCRAFWAHPKHGNGCLRLADTGGSVVPCTLECIARS